LPDQPEQDFLSEPAVRRPVRCRRDKKADPAQPAAHCRPEAPCALLCTGTAWAVARACSPPALAGGARCGRTLTAHGARVQRTTSWSCRACTRSCAASSCRSCTWRRPRRRWRRRCAAARLRLNIRTRRGGRRCMERCQMRGRPACPAHAGHLRAGKHLFLSARFRQHTYRTATAGSGSPLPDPALLPALHCKGGRGGAGCRAIVGAVHARPPGHSNWANLKLIMTWVPYPRQCG